MSGHEERQRHTSVDVEIDPHCRRLGRSQTDFVLQAIVLVECRRKRNESQCCCAGMPIMMAVKCASVSVGCIDLWKKGASLSHNNPKRCEVTAQICFFF